MALPLTSTFSPAPGWTVQTGEGGNQSLIKGFASGAFSSPYLNGFLAQSLEVDDLATGGTGVSLTLGTAFGARVIVPNIAVSAKGAVLVATAAVSPTHGWLYLLDASGNLKASTADMGAAAFTATGLDAVAWTSPVTLPPGPYLVVAVQVGGTAAKLFGAASPSALLNVNTSAVAGAGVFRFSQVATGVGAGGLAVPVTMTGITADSALQMFAGLL